MYRTKLLATLSLALLLSTGAGTQPAADLDISSLGPQVGARVPDFSGTDQFGKAHTLQSSLGPKGAMLVFFRSADW